MAQHQIPVQPALAAQKMSIVLDGVRYTLRFYFCFRQDTWLMDILDDTETEIIVGKKLVVDYPLMHLHQLPTRTPGEFYAIDTSGNRQPAGLRDFGVGQRVIMVYDDQVEQ